MNNHTVRANGLAMGNRAYEYMKKYELFKMYGGDGRTPYANRIIRGLIRTLFKLEIM